MMLKLLPWKTRSNNGLSADDLVTPVENDVFVDRSDYSPLTIPESARHLRQVLGRDVDLTRLVYAVKRPTITISISEESVRMVVFDGQSVIAWGSAGIPGANDAEVVRAPIEAQIIESWVAQLKNELGVRRYRLLIDAPLYDSLLRHKIIPKMPRRYLDRVITSEVIESIPFAEGEVDLTWQLKQLEDEHEVFAVAMPKKLVDQRAELLINNGMRPYAIHSQAVTLALATGGQDSIVVHVTATFADCVFVSHGIPLVVHRVFRGENLPDTDSWLMAVSDGIDQVGGFSEELSGNDDSDQLPVLLVGMHSGNPALISALVQTTQRVVIPCQGIGAYPVGFQASEFASNIGLALTVEPIKSKEKITFKGGARVGLLPDRHLPKKAPIAALLTFGLLGILAAMAIGLSMVTGSLAADLSDTSDRLARAERLARIREAPINNIVIDAGNLGTLANGIRTQIAEFQTDINKLISRARTIAITARPNGVSIPAVGSEQEEVVVSGTAVSPESIFEYAANLRQSEFFEYATVVSITASDGSVSSQGSDSELSFSISVLVDPIEEPEGQ